MKQLNMLEPEESKLVFEGQISGLKYIPNYINKGKELELIDIIDKQSWYD